MMNSSNSIRIETQALVTVRGLHKSYGLVKAIKGLDLSVPRGSIFGILGPNGSGKTTLFSILLDLVHADQGEVEWLHGKKGAALRKEVGSLVETPDFYPSLSAWDNLGLVSKIRGLDHDDRPRVLGIMGLFDRKDDAVQTYSLGMKQRLGFAAALLGSPKVLVLDEPTHGMDPAGILATRKLIIDLHSQGTTILLASHLLGEVEKTCTHIAILDRGKLKAQGPLASLMPSSMQVLIQGPEVYGLYLVLSQWKELDKVERREDGIVVHFQPPISAARINQYCLEHKMEISLLQPLGQDLESLYISLTGISAS